jgi:hypothetical protein
VNPDSPWVLRLSRQSGLRCGEAVGQCLRTLAVALAFPAWSAGALAQGQGEVAVAAGLIDNMSRPGGNVTGIFFRQVGLSGKRLELLAARAAYFVDRLLRGATPGDLPVEEAARFELSINLKTAQALGVKVPETALILADEVIR